MTWSLLGGTKSLAVEQPVQNGPFPTQASSSIAQPIG